jgi:cell division transport system permease protein
VALKVDYVVRETATNLRRNLLLTTASVLTVAVSLSMVGAVMFLRFGVDNATARWKNGVEFEVFMNTTATPDQQSAVARALNEHPEIAEVTFIDRATQYEYYRDFAKDSPELLEAVRPEDLPESYRVRPTVEDAQRIAAIGEQFKERPGVYRVAFAKDAVDTAFRTSRGLQLGMFAVAIVLFAASALLIFNTIRMAIFSRRREIEVMKLVGATNSFIRVPFMLEGLIQGLAGSIVTFGALWTLREPLARWVVETFSQFDGFAVDAGQVLGIGLLTLLVGSAIGAVSAGVAVTRFLDV